jgi:hypothetical protein
MKYAYYVMDDQGRRSNIPTSLKHNARADAARLNKRHKRHRVIFSMVFVELTPENMRAVMALPESPYIIL